MAAKNVKKFLNLVAKDKDLAERLKTANDEYAKAAKDEIQSDKAKNAATKAILVPLAEEVGLPFTVEEFAAFRKTANLSEEEGELLDDELSQVAGGSNNLEEFRNMLNQMSYRYPPLFW